ncbi:hypothetical protein [Pseudomonas amygdali]|uniref:hypothetical protein n=1 Tax=Pseudomonas amygdali TaxID=47877 RepID=UPI0011C4A39B|nr:hypothetical protein [Pseudomonas amygdali]
MNQPSRVLTGSVLSGLLELLAIEWEHYKRDMPDGDCLSQDMCLLSTTYLYWLFKHAGLGGWEPMEGVGQDEQGDDNPGGMVAVDGRWYSHNWLAHHSGAILDLTADQFGHDQIILSSTSDPRYHANRPPAYAMERLQSCKLGKEWLEFQLDDGDSMKILGPILTALRPGWTSELSPQAYP